MMKTLNIPEDIPIVCITASSFPDGVMEAHRKLHALISHDKERRYYSVSYMGPENKILYMAGAEIVEEKDHALPGTEKFTIPKGDYISEPIHNYMQNLPAIGQTFEQMLKRADIDPNGYCLEHYLDDKTVVCMVPLEQRGEG
jgi:predicted transcriptional regulator YdeE